MKRTGFKQKPRKPLKSSGFKRSSTKPPKRKENATTGQTGGKKRVKKLKPDRMKTLKDKLWRTFSIYIRQKDADHTGYVETCDGQIKHWKEVHCGHLFHNTERNKQLGGNELWYYENNFAPQSSDGNYFNKDDSAKKYTLWAVRKYGIEEVEKMQKLKQIPRKFTEEELQAKYEHYKQLIDKE